MLKVAIIGTAGRDKTKPMTERLWHWMLDHARRELHQGHHLVSGGAAWADHLAVALFLEGHCPKLTLHLPAPLGPKGFNGPYKSAATAANYYHARFSQAVGIFSIAQLHEAEAKGADGTFQLEAPGYGAMFARNKLVVHDADVMLAYTFGEGTEPANGGTKHTWDMFKGQKVHVSLPHFEY